MKDMYSKIVLGVIAVSLSILAIKNLDIISSANAVVDFHPNTYGMVEKKTEPMVGEIKIFAGDYAPEGWAFCDGAEMEIKTYKDLYTVIGDVYGGDEEEKTFSLPNLIGRSAIGIGKDDKVAEIALGGNRSFFSNMIRESKRGIATLSGKTTLKRQSNGLGTNVPNTVRTADLGLNYIICVKGVILD